MLDWMRDHPGVMTALAVVSIVMFIGSLIVVPMIAARIPADYFAHERRLPAEMSVKDLRAHIDELVESGHQPARLPARA